MRSHDLDVLALMAGAAFAGVALCALLGDGAGLQGRWTWPVLLILVGVIGLAANRRGPNR